VTQLRRLIIFVQFPVFVDFGNLSRISEAFRNLIRLTLMWPNYASAWRAQGPQSRYDGCGDKEVVVVEFSAATSSLDPWGPQHNSSH